MKDRTWTTSTLATSRRQCYDDVLQEEIDKTHLAERRSLRLSQFVLFTYLYHRLRQPRPITAGAVRTCREVLLGLLLCEAAFDDAGGRIRRRQR
jgi:hypothetical protein